MNTDRLMADLGVVAFQTGIPAFHIPRLSQSPTLAAGFIAAVAAGTHEAFLADLDDRSEVLTA